MRTFRGRRAFRTKPILDPPKIRSIRNLGRYNKKTIRSIADLWADNQDEKSQLTRIGIEMIMSVHDYDRIRAKFMEIELCKCINAGLVENVSRITDMLKSPDLEMSKLGFEIVYTLREKRLNGK